MWILLLAWKNLWRNRNRTLITMAAIFFSVLLSILTSSFKTGVFDNLVNNMVSYYSGYIQIHQKGYWEEQLLDNSFQMSTSLKASVQQIKGVTGVSPRLESFALASSEELSKGCMVVGIDPIEENKITSLSSNLVQGRYIQKEDKGVLISAGLLSRMKLQLKDTLVLIGQGYHGSTAAGKYPIIGVVKFGSPQLNDQVLYMPIALAQEMYGAPNMATAYVMSIQKMSDVNSIAKQTQKIISNHFEVMTWEQMMPEIKQHIETDTNNMKVIQAILYLLVSFGIFGTLLMMMAERRYELAMLIAIGMKKYKLSILLLIESIMTVVLGCVIGIAVSIPVVYYYYIHPIRLSGEAAKTYEDFGFEAVFPTSIHSDHFINQAIVVLVIGLILSLYPIYHIIKLNIANAMRK